MPYRWIFLDADNTLLDYHRAEKQALTESLQAFGFTCIPARHERYRQINKACWQDLEAGRTTRQEMRLARFRSFFEAEGLQVDIDGFADTYQQALAAQAHLLEGARHLVENLSVRYRLALVTNGIATIQRPRLKQSGLAAFFQAVVMSEEAGHAKPHPAFFRRALSITGQPPPRDVLMVGDNWQADIEGAHHMGMHTCWFNPERLPRPGGMRPTLEIQALGELLQLLD